MNFACAGDVAGLRVVAEMLAINLVVAVMLMSIDHDVNIAQVGVPSGLELHRFGGANGVQRAPALRLRERETFAGLLNVDAKFTGNVMQGRFHPKSRSVIGDADNGDHQDSGRHQPLAGFYQGLQHRCSDFNCFSLSA